MRRSASPAGVTTAVMELLAGFGSGALLSVIVAVRSYRPVDSTISASAIAAVLGGIDPMVQIPVVLS